MGVCSIVVDIMCSVSGGLCLKCDEVRMRTYCRVEFKLDIAVVYSENFEP